MKKAVLNLNNIIKGLTITIVLILACFSSNAQLNGNNFIDPAGIDFVGNPLGVSGKTYTTFTKACAALSSYGVNGPVTFMVAAGTYTEQVMLNNIATATAVNTITFDGGDGNAATRILTFTATTAAASYTWQLNACNFIRIRNLKIVANGATYGICLHMFGLTTNIQIKKCIFTYGTAGLTSASQNFVAVLLFNSNASKGSCSGNPTAAASWGVFVDSNTIIGGGYGMGFSNSGNGASGTSEIIVTNNNIQSVGGIGINWSNCTGLTVDYNIINLRGGQGVYGCNGSTTGAQKYEFIGNQVYNCTGGGIWLQTVNSNGARNRIMNNLIYATGSTAISGLYEKGNDVWFNSVYMNSTSASAYGINFNPSSYAGQHIRNNDIGFMNTGSTGYPLYFPNIVDGIAQTTVIEYNNLYKANSASPALMYNGGLTYDANTLKGSNNMNNVFFNKASGFLSTTDVHYNPALVPIYGDPSLGIATDVDREQRCLIAPTIGGDESKYVAPTPNTNFTVPDTIFKKNQADFLNPSSVGMPYLYKWYLNGALKATTLNWSNTFATAGTYKVKLVAAAYCGASDSTEKTVTVINPFKAPIADFLANTNFARTIDNVYLYDQSLNGPLQWKWTITPGTAYDPSTGANEATYRYVNSTNSTSQNPVIVLKYTGQYSICLKISNSFGYDSICKQDFIVIRTAVNMCSQTVSNSNYGVLYDDGGPTANYTNSKNCNILITPCSPNLSLNIKSFNLVTGDYLRIYDGVDNTGTKLYNTTLFPNGFTGDKTITPTIPSSIVSQTGTIYIEYVTDAATVSTGFEIEWDGAPKVVSSPHASFTMSDTTICKGRPIIFKNTSTGYGNKYYWDLDGDGVIDATTVHTSFTYQAAGTYEISLIAENCGGIDTFRKVVTVYSPTTKPIVEFDADILNPGIGTDIVTFIDKSYRCADQWEWTFTPSTVSFRNFTTKNSMNPQVSFNATSCYTVKLVAGCNGNKDSITKTCYINVLNYCVPVVSIYSRDIGISRVLLGNINSVSDITATGYTNYSKQYSTNMFITFPYTITVERLTAFNNISIYVWIDLNNDGDFTDAGEKVAFTNSNAGLTWSARFYVPASATEGKTRMRIGTNFENLPNLPCGANLYGEYEDYLVNLQKDHAKPVITLIGAPSITIEAGTPYSDPGVIVTDNMDTNISSKIVTVNPVNTSVIDTYYVTYNVTDASGNIADQVTRRVIVTLDITPPQLTLSGLDTMYIEVYSPYVEPGYTSIDKPWGTNLTSSVIVTGTVDTTVVGMYVINYKSTDAYGNIATKDRVVFVRDSQVPIITLTGANPSYVEVFHKYIDPGYVVTDNYCAPATLIPTITGNLDTSQLGTYNYTYQITDCNGNGPVVVTRNVIVYDSTKPVLSFNMDQDTIDVEVFSQFADPGIVINDNYYTNLSPVISGTFYTTFPLGVPKTLGFYIIIYTVTDGSNNVGIITRVIHVVDTKAPVITLVGPELVTVKACNWPNYVDQGYTVTDNYDPVGSITIDTVQKFTNSMDTTRYFKVQYKATDGSGNVAYSDERYIDVKGVSGIAGDMDRFIKVYPNPTEGFVTINISLSANEDISVRLFDVMGREKMNIFQGNIQSKTINLDLTDQSKGVYFVRFTYNNESYNKMLIVR